MPGTGNQGTAAIITVRRQGVRWVVGEADDAKSRLSCPLPCFSEAFISLWAVLITSFNRCGRAWLSRRLYVALEAEQREGA